MKSKETQTINLTVEEAVSVCKQRELQGYAFDFNVKETAKRKVTVVEIVTERKDDTWQDIEHFTCGNSLFMETSMVNIKTSSWFDFIWLNYFP